MSKREDILKAALELFAQYGYYGTPVPMIAKRAKVGAGTIYRYFKGKDELVNQLYAYWKKELFLKAFDSMHPEHPLRSRFRELWFGMAEAVMSNPVAFSFVDAHYHGAYLDQASQDVTSDFQRKIEGFFNEGIEKEVFRQASPKLLAAVAIGSFSSMVECFLAGYLEYNQENLSQVEEMCWQAVRR